MPNRKREIIILDASEIANLLHTNLVRHLNSKLVIQTFELEKCFIAYLNAYQGAISSIYLNENFSDDLDALLSAIRKLQFDTDLSVIGEHEKGQNISLKHGVRHVHEDAFMQELTQSLSY